MKPTPNDELVVETDGAAEPNPGPAAIGAIIWNTDGDIVAEISEYIGPGTNNKAEYRAVIAGLQKAKKLGAKRVTLRSDSELLVKQISGEYRVRNAALAPLYHRVVGLLVSFNKYKVTHIDGTYNVAHGLAHEALKRALARERES